MSPPEGPGEGEERAPAAEAPAGAVRVPPREPTPLYRALARALLRLEAIVQRRGSPMVRLVNFAVWFLVGVAGLQLLYGPVINKPLELEDITAAASDAADTWIIRQFDGAYEVERTDDGRMLLQVRERLDVVFPEGVSETGITRTIASHYQSHDLAPEVRAAWIDGDPAEVSLQRGATTATLRWEHGAPLTGAHEFVVEYTLSDVAFATVDASTGQAQDLLEWDVFGPSSPQGITGTSATITLPRDLDEALVRSPRAAVAWVILSDASAMEPDTETASEVTYVITNGQTLPPHAQLWFTFRFASGTFAMPDPAPLYWVLVIGPFLPLLLLAAGVLFALAARAVVWPDARGRAWFVHQDEPQPDISAAVAVRLVRRLPVTPLVDAMPDPADGMDSATRTRLARIAWRTGRVGNLLDAWRRYVFGPAWREQFRRGLRRVPRGVVRDVFVFSAVALFIVQFGLIRQLSYQLPLSVYWWPVAVGVATVLLAGTILVLALSARPLTQKGALAREHLLGLELFVRQTTAAGRIALSDPLLPYVVMFTPARQAGELVGELVRRPGDDRHAARGFLTGVRLGIRALGVLAVVGAILVTQLVRSPSAAPPEDLAYSGDLPGGRGWVVSAFAADAHLEVTADGRPQVSVEETLQVLVDDSRDSLAQVMRQWRDVVAGHDLGLRVEEVAVDGDAVAFDTRREQGMAFAQTALVDDWGGEHEVRIRYVLTDPAAAVLVDGQWRDRIHWTALNSGWESAWSWQEEGVISRIALTLRMPDDLAAVRDADSGWLIGRDGVDTRPLAPGTRDGSDRVYRWEQQPDADGWWDSAVQGDHGMILDLPAGTLAGPAPEEWHLAQVRAALPATLVMTVAGASIALALIGIFARRTRAVRETGALRDAVRWLAPCLAVATAILFIWLTAEDTGDSPVFATVGLTALAAAMLSVAGVVLTRRRR